MHVGISKFLSLALNMAKVHNYYSTNQCSVCLLTTVYIDIILRGCVFGNISAMHIDFYRYLHILDDIYAIHIHTRAICVLLLMWLYTFTIIKVWYTVSGGRLIHNPFSQSSVLPWTVPYDHERDMSLLYCAIKSAARTLSYYSVAITQVRRWP